VSINFHSKTNSMNICIAPPKPSITKSETGSRSINITWKIDEIAYIQSFDIYVNNISVGNISVPSDLINKTEFSFHITDVLPFRRHVDFNSS
jgi:hypothetical protein